MSIADPHMTAQATRVSLPAPRWFNPAAQVLAIIALALVVLALAVWTWGLVALTMTALLAVPVVFVLLIRITLG